MISFQFFCNNTFKQKNIDKLVPNGMSYNEWNTQKAQILDREIESMHTYLEQQASIRLAGLQTANKEDIEERFQDTITRAISDYKEKIYNHYR